MEFNKNVSTSSDISQLTNEITYHRYMMNRVSVRRFFHDLSMQDYIVLAMAGKKASDGQADEKLYLKDIARQMEIPVSRASKIVGKLEERGLIHWSHDGNGSEGTYIIIDDEGKQLMKQEETALKEFYTRVIGRYGKEEFVRLLQMMGRLETIMKEEAQEGGEDDEE